MENPPSTCVSWGDTILGIFG